MSGGELAVVLASVAVVVAVAVLGAVGVSLNRSLRDLRRLMTEIRNDVLPAVRRIEEVSGQVTGEVERVGGLLDVAERVSERAEELSRMTLRAVVEPFSAVASLFRRGGPAEPDTGAAAGSAATTRAATGSVGTTRPAAASVASRRGSWMRRTTTYLLRTGYRTTAARIAARLAASQAQRTATATRTDRGSTATGASAGADRSGSRTGSTSAARANRSGSATGTSGAEPDAAPGGADSPLRRQLLDAVREVTEEISAALAEGREALRADRKAEDSPE